MYDENFYKVYLLLRKKFFFSEMQGGGHVILCASRISYHLVEDRVLLLSLMISILLSLMIAVRQAAYLDERPTPLINGNMRI